MKAGKYLTCARINNGDNLRQESVSEPSKKHLKCPICKSQVEADRAKNSFLPFCSERCQTIDLGKWLDGKYVIEGDEPISDPEQ